MRVEISMSRDFEFVLLPIYRPGSQTWLRISLPFPTKRSSLPSLVHFSGITDRQVCRSQPTVKGGVLLPLLDDLFLQTRLTKDLISMGPGQMFPSKKKESFFRRRIIYLTDSQMVYWLTSIKQGLV